MSGSLEATFAEVMDSMTVRDGLVEALKLDLVGPGVGDALVDEVLPGWVRPSNWYLTGFLVPTDAPLDQRSDADEDDPLDETPEEAGLAEESSDERRPAKRGFFPSSIGLSFLVPASLDGLAVTVRWGDYKKSERRDADDKSVSIWQRQPRQCSVEVTLAEEASDFPVPQSDGLQLHVVARSINMAGVARLGDGTKSVSVFLVNGRRSTTIDPDDPESSGHAERTYVFQAELEVASDQPFVPRPDPREARVADWDDQVADLHYADVSEYAVGHGVSADWDEVDGECRSLRTAWIPRATVAKTETANVEDALLSMDGLGALADGEAASRALTPLVAHYRGWLSGQTQVASGHSEDRQSVAEVLLSHAEFAADRIERGIALLAEDADALDAFRVANRAVARALSQRLGDEEPRWRAFQLAFILLNIGGIADRHSAEREIVDLLFFPTGGGKTEAYLGLAAFTIVLRRLRRPAQQGLEGAGVAVVMRYTLRLLTLDQLARAAGLVCALELERDANPGRYGTWPIEIGLWVGAKPPLPTSWAARAIGVRTAHGARRVSTRPTRTSRFPSRLRTARGAAPNSSRPRSPCCPMTTTQMSCGSSALTSNAISAATGHCPSWELTNPSTDACRHSSSPRSTSLRRCRLQVRQECCSAGPTATTPRASTAELNRGVARSWADPWRRLIS